jgi:hypothetical protein
MHLCFERKSFLNWARAALSIKIILIIKTLNLQRSNNPCTDLDIPCGFQEFEVPRFYENRRIKVESSWALRTWHDFVMIMSMKNSNYPIGNRARDLPAVPLRASFKPSAKVNFLEVSSVQSLTSYHVRRLVYSNN